MSDQILVKFKPGTPTAVAEEVHRRLGDQRVQIPPRIEVHVVRVPLGKVPDMVKNYRLEAVVEFAEPDYIATAFYVPSDITPTNGLFPRSKRLSPGI